MRRTALGSVLTLGSALGSALTAATVLLACGPAARAPTPASSASSASAPASSVSSAAAAKPSSSAPAVASGSASAIVSSAGVAAIGPEVLVPGDDPTSTLRRGPTPAPSSDPDQTFQRDEPPSEVTIAVAAGTPDAKQVLARNRWRFRACHVKALETIPDAAGTLKLKLALTDDGKVDVATPGGGTAPAELAACARAQAKLLRFAPPPEGADAVIVVLVFAREP